MMLIKTSDGAVYGKVDKNSSSGELDGQLTVIPNKSPRIIFKDQKGAAYSMQ